MESAEGPHSTGGTMRFLASQVHVKRERGGLVINAMGQTPRGTAFIKKSRKLAVKSIGEKGFKAEMKLAIEEIFANQP